MSTPRHQLRIIGGSHRGRIIRFSEAGRLPGFRPTPDRVRETLFNWLGQTLEGRSCLDLFAGSGALALEAASRGARRVVAVERVPAAAAAIERNRSHFALDAMVCHCADALGFLTRTEERFDIIFLDPPFALDLWRELARLVPARLAHGGAVYAEAGRPLADFADLTLHRSGRAGMVHYHLFVHNDGAPAGQPSEA